MEQIDEILNCINNAKKRGDNCCLIVEKKTFLKRC